MQLSEINRLVKEATALLSSLQPNHLGLAVSGGGDSLAMLHLLAPWAKDRNIRLSVATVDHGLRPESAEEAVTVGQICKGLGIPHKTLKWMNWDGKGNLQDRARRARQQLLLAWAETEGIDCIALGHTSDDQAENFLLRLTRGSGVDGLSGMDPVRQINNLHWVRPMLGVRREELRRYLKARQIGWMDDPSNDDLRFDRVRARKLLKELNVMGLTSAKLVETSGRMQMARDALEHFAKMSAKACTRIEAGDVVMDSPALLRLPKETILRLLAHGISWVASAEYRPRMKALEAALGDMTQNRKRSLHGTFLIPGRNQIRIVREYKAVAEKQCGIHEVWDRRWRLSGQETKGLQVRALGERGLRECPDWRETNLPRESLISSPSVWNDADLVAAPLAGRPNGWQLQLLRSAEQYHSSILSH